MRSRNPFFFIFALFLTPLVLHAQIKIATVNMDRVFLECHEIKAQEEQLKADLENLRNDPGLAAIKAEHASITQQRENLITSNESEKERKQLLKDLQGRAREFQSLKKDTAERINQERIKLQKRIVDVSRINLENIQQIIQSYARKNNFDLVLDGSAKSNSRLPSLLYKQNTIDITDAIILLVNKE